MNLANRVTSPSVSILALCGALVLAAASLMASPVHAQAQPAAAPQKLTASAIQIQPVDAPQGLVMPEDFRISTYENVIREVEKTKKFEHVYRSGDSAAASAKDLVVVHMIPEAFKPGSQKEREVTTVAGATSIKMKVQFTSPDGKVLLEKDLEGHVRFYGENLRATYDLAKKVASVVTETF
jgi:hypothetical protein